jgi:hypothetical protein
MPKKLELIIQHGKPKAGSWYLTTEDDVVIDFIGRWNFRP